MKLLEIMWGLVKENWNCNVEKRRKFWRDLEAINCILILRLYNESLQRQVGISNEIVVIVK